MDSRKLLWVMACGDCLGDFGITLASSCLECSCAMTIGLDKLRQEQSISHQPASAHLHSCTLTVDTYERKRYPFHVHALLTQAQEKRLEIHQGRDEQRRGQFGGLSPILSVPISQAPSEISPPPPASTACGPRYFRLPPFCLHRLHRPLQSSHLCPQPLSFFCHWMVQLPW